MSLTLGQFVRARLDETEDTRARQATRLLIAEQELADAEAEYPDWMGGYSSGLDYALQLAAAEWADHPDYSPEFVPESQWEPPTA
ncbi:hypothetical protein [Streptomyces sp. NPDC060027]|uniref:hypothetical protein n=1 Tax=Streptomyces sp. NPDC060027 TaxID=3347040 RepID=UPI003679BA60